MHFEFDFASLKPVIVSDVGPVVSMIAERGLPSVTYLGINLEHDVPVDSSLGDLRGLFAGLPALEELKAHGRLETMGGSRSLKLCEFDILEPSTAVLEAWRESNWPCLERLAIRVSESPFPEDFEVRRDLAEFNDLPWPVRSLPEVSARRHPKLKALELDTAGSALPALEMLIAQPDLLRALTELRIDAACVTREASELLLANAELFCQIETLIVRGSVGWAIGSTEAKALAASLPNLAGVQPNRPYEQGGAASGGSAYEESNELYPMYTTLTEAERTSEAWWRETDELELSVATQVAILRIGDSVLLGVLGQLDVATLVTKYSWDLRSVGEMKEILLQFGVRLGEPISAWDPTAWEY